MRWKRAWTTFCLALCVGLGLGAVERPNFVVIIGDDIGWNDFGAYGHPTVKTPLVVSWPGRVAGGRASASLVSSIDLAPTLLELAGVEAGPSFEGVSFAPLLDDPGASTREAVFAEHNWHDYRAFERSVRTKDFLYIRNWLPHLPGTPPADAVRSPTFAEVGAPRTRWPSCGGWGASS